MQGRARPFLVPNAVDLRSHQERLATQSLVSHGIVRTLDHGVGV